MQRLAYLSRMWKVIVSALAWFGLIFALNHSWQAGQITLPPFGKFFSPGAGFWRNAEPIKHRPDRTLTLDGVQAPVRILFDERLVPHIFAENALDAFYAQGYVTAMARLWQMDISARAAAGELAAIFGTHALSYDRTQREIGMGFAAENALEGWKKYPDDLAVIEAYTAGVNAYISTLKPASYPVEFKLMGYRPAPWTPLKTAYFVKSMASRLCFFEDDLEHTLLLKWLGRARFDRLFPRHNPMDDPVIPPGTPWNFTPLTSVDSTIVPAGANPTGAADESLEVRLEGSNNWAVSGARTQSGKPILCNDPHLMLSLPSVWYEIQIATPEFNVYGVSLPAFPGVIIGFNSHLAWGETNAGYDVLDWYSIDWADPGHTAYLLDGKTVPVDHRIEKIAVKGGATVFDTVAYTHWGPVQKEGPHAGLAMRWLSHDVPDDREAATFIQLNQAKSYEDFLKALSYYQTPAQNFVYADQKGNIAMQVAGRIPLRHDLNGRFVEDGSVATHGWMGRIPAAQNPSVLNPPRGFVSSANQESTDSTYPYLYFGLFEEYRGRILNRYLSQLQHCTPQDMMALQNNDVSLKAEELLPLLLSAIHPADTRAQDIAMLLSDWKYAYVKSEKAPVFYELWYAAFSRLLWDDFYTRMDTEYIRTPQDWSMNDLVIEHPDSKEFDVDSTNQVETFADIAQMSFNTAQRQYENLPNDQRTWGGYHHTTIRHLANIPALSRMLSTPGTKDVLNAITPSHGPSWRMIVQLTDTIQAYVVYPGGESGNPGSPYYDDMIDSWAQGKYFVAHYLQSPDALDPVQQIEIKPSGK